MSVGRLVAHRASDSDVELASERRADLSDVLVVPHRANSAHVRAHCDVGPAHRVAVRGL